MLGQMQSHPLMIASILTHAARHHGEADIVSRGEDGTLTRATYRDVERRARRLASALAGLGIGPHERIGTLAWNSQRHLEIYYGVQGMKAVCHTVNPRLHAEDIAWIINHGGDRMLMADPGFAPLLRTILPLIAGTVTDLVLLAGPDEMPAFTPPDGITLHCYETLIEGAEPIAAWPTFDENTAGLLCYTSGTTGRPKGVLYSHRSTLLHALAINGPDALGIRAIDRVMPVVPMFHVNAWGLPYIAPLCGAALVMPGRHLDGASLASLMNEERVTMSAGVPTVWLGLLAHLRASGERLATLERIVVGGAACPPLLIEAFDREYGIEVKHAWGMTELSPLGSVNTLKPQHSGLTREQRHAFSLKQGRAPFGIDMKITGPDGQDQPWDGVSFGDLKVRGPFVCDAYFGDEPGSATDDGGWFATGDVAVIGPDGVMEITDRSKDVIKSGGEWISSITLENLAVSHPDVAEAAVIAARHPKWDERPLLIVRPAAGRTIDTDALMTVFDGQVPNWWRPDAVIVVDDLPHTATGKLQKNVLRSTYGDALIGG
jgi:fatty-acyl-CoA synthase